MHTSILRASNIGIVSFLIIAYTVIPGASEEETCRMAFKHSQSGAVIPAVIVRAASASLFAIGYLLNQRVR